MNKREKMRIAKRFFKQHPSVVTGIWCFFEISAAAKVEYGIEIDGRFFAVTYQSGQGYDFSVELNQAQQIALLPFKENEDPYIRRIS